MFGMDEWVELLFKRALKLYKRSFFMDEKFEFWMEISNLVQLYRTTQ